MITDLLDFNITYAVDVVIRLVIAFFAGILIGYGREKERKPAGIKTHTLVCIGASLVMMTGEYAYLEYGVDQVTRMAAQVISGIGFLGAGTILVTRSNRISGLTTAASLWFTACLGVTIGIGFYEAAFIALFAIIIVMQVLEKIDDKIYENLTTIQLHILIPDLKKTRLIYEKLEELNCELLSVNPEINRGHKRDSTFVYFNITIKTPKSLKREDLLHQISELEDVIFVEIH